MVIYRCRNIKNNDFSVGDFANYKQFNPFLKKHLIHEKQHYITNYFKIIWLRCDKLCVIRNWSNFTMNIEIDSVKDNQLSWTTLSYVRRIRYLLLINFTACLYGVRKCLLIN